MKAIRIVAIVLGIYVALGLVLDGAIGYFQPQTESTAVPARRSSASSARFELALTE